MQDHIGTLETATALARELEAANHRTIDVAVVSEISSNRAVLGYWSNLIRLDSGS